MNIERLSELLLPWMQVETWHTTHPSDQKRFNMALASVIRELGHQVTYDDLKDAIELLLEKHHPNLILGNFESEIDRCAGNAEIITSYVCDTQ